MKKDIAVARMTVQDYMAYRMNFFMWRIRQDVSLLVLFFLWSAIFSGKVRIFGYTEPQILTYVFSGAVLKPLVLGTTTFGIGSMINDGTLTNIILQPMDFFRRFAVRDVADKLLNLACVVLEVGVLLFLLKPVISGPAGLLPVVLSFVGILLGAASYFFFSLIFGLFGFWTNEVWAPRFLMFVVIDFFSGGLFPLDVLPGWLYRISLLTPFPYFIYFPVSVFLGKMAGPDIVRGFAVAIMWAVVFFLAARQMWNSGLKVYEGQGR